VLAPRNNDLGRKAVQSGNQALPFLRTFLDGSGEEEVKEGKEQLYSMAVLAKDGRC